MIAGVLWIGSANGQSSPEWALKGRNAYQDGRLDLARMYFQRAMEEAVLNGVDDWLVKAALNLIDVELEAHNLEDALKLLDQVPSSSDPELRSLVLWKKSQALHAQKRVHEASVVCDSALSLLPRGHMAKPSMEADRLRIALSGDKNGEWDSDLKRFEKKYGNKEKVLVRSLRAAAAMHEGNFTEAADLWRRLAVDYRERGRLSQVAASLNRLALCGLALGDSAAALEDNRKAVGIYREMGLALPALRAHALIFLIGGDDAELAKSRREMDFVGLGRTGFDLQDVLDEYAQFLPASPPVR